MTRRSKRLQSISSDTNFTQSRLDSEYGIKSNLLIKTPPKSNLNTKLIVDGVKTRSMTKLSSDNSSYRDLLENDLTNKDTKAIENEISSPKKKSKTKKNSSKKNFLSGNMHLTSEGKLITESVEKNKKVDEKQDIKVFKNNNSESNQKKSLKIDQEDFSKENELEFQLDEFLQPTAPESQISSPKTDNLKEDIYISTFSEEKLKYTEKKTLDLLNKNINMNSSTYDNIFNNKDLLERLKKIPLPKKYEYIIDVFQGLEIILRLLERRQKPFFYPSFIKEQVENVTKKQFNIDNLLRILWIAPQLISVKWCKTNKNEFENFNSPLNKKDEFFNGYELELIVNQGLEKPVNRLSHSNINERIDILRLTLLEFVLIQQENYLKNIVSENIHVQINLLDLKNWSSFFNIEDCVDIPKYKLPPKDKKDYDSIKVSKNNNEERFKSVSLTPSLRDLYKLRFMSNFSVIENDLEIKKKTVPGRRSVSADDSKTRNFQENNSGFQTPIRNGNNHDLENKVEKNIAKDYQNNSSKTNMYSTPKRNTLSSTMLSRSISPNIVASPLNTPLYTKLSKSVLNSRNKNLLTPSQKELLENVRRREKIKEISNLINIEDDEYNNKLEDIKNEIWTIQQLSFIFLRSKKVIPTIQLPLLAKRLTTYARNCPEIDQVQEAIIRLSSEWPEVIKLGNSTVEKGTKLVKLQINDCNLSEIIKKLTQKKELVIKQREEFRLNAIKNYQK